MLVIVYCNQYVYRSAPKVQIFHTLCMDILDQPFHIIGARPSIISIDSSTNT